MPDTAAVAALREMFEREMRQQRRGDRIMRAVAIVAGVVIVVLAAITMTASLDTVNTIRDQTSPAQARRNQAEIQKIVGAIVLCVGNRDERVIAAAFHQPLPPLRKDCPADRG